MGGSPGPVFRNDPRAPDASLFSDWLDGGERPGAVEDFRPRSVEPNDVVPAVCNREAVRPVVTATAEVDGDRAVPVRCGGDVVDTVGVSIVPLEEASGVVDRDRPEAVNGHVSHCELVIALDAAGIDADV